MLPFVKKLLIKSLIKAVPYRTCIQVKMIWDVSPAWRGIGIIRFLSKYVAHNVLDQIYKLCVRPYQDYGDIITSVTQSLNLTSPKSWSPPSANTDKLYEELGWEFFTTGGGIDSCVTSINCAMIRDPCTYSLKYLKNVPFTTVYVDLVHMSQMLKVLRDS